jgi:hypothetical protein
VGASLSTVDTMRGAEYQARFVTLAVRVGGPSRLARGLALEAAYAATTGAPGWRRAQRLLERAEALAAAAGELLDQGWVALGRAIAALVAGEYEVSRAAADRALDLLARVAGAAWERRSARVFGIWASYFAGDVASFSTRTRAALQDAQDHGDHFSGAQLRLGVCNTIWLFADAPDEAARQLEQAIAAWAPPEFQLPSYYHMVGRAQVGLYQGRAIEAHAELKSRWDALERSMLLRIDFIATDAWFLRGRLALAAGALSGPRERAGLVADARRAARAVRARSSRWRRGMASLLEAGIAHGRGRRDRAIIELASAAEQFEATGMAMHAAAARHRRALLSGADATPELAWAVGCGVREPARWYDVLAPGFSARDE